MTDLPHEVSIPEYLTVFSNLRTPLSDFYVKTGRCKILGISGRNTAARAFLLAEQKDITELLFITADHGAPALKKSLLDHLKMQLPSGSAIRWRIQDNAADEELALEYGFSPESVVNIFHSLELQDPHTEEQLRKYEKLYLAKERFGYHTVSFAELSAGALCQITDDSDGEFEKAFSPKSFLCSSASGFSPELSFATLKGGKVVAYSMIRRPDSAACIFEIICVAKSKRMLGLFVLPFYASFRAIKDTDAKKVLFSVYENNSQMMKLVRKHLSPLVASKKCQHNMICYIP